MVLFLVELYQQLGLRDVHVGLFCENYPSLHDRQISKIEVEFPNWLGTLRKGVTREFVLHEHYGSGVIALRNLDDPSKYLSAEFAAIGVDELTRNKQKIFDFLRMRLRWPGVQRPLFGAATNPGGEGHVWVKNYWIDGKFPLELQPLKSEFKFVKALPTDNPHLPQKYFEDLKTLPEQMRKAYAECDWNLLAGQYFGHFSESRHVVEPCELRPWWPKWISGDWGFAHPACIHWHTRKDDGVVLTYRELYGQGIGEAELGQAIADSTPPSERIQYIFFSPDAFAKRGASHTVAEQVGAELPSSYPQLTPADNDRIGGARLMHQLLASDQWQISRDCPNLIECLPTLLRDDEKLEDVLKVDFAPGQIGDDPYDSARYGLKSYLSPGNKPREVVIDEQIEEWKNEGKFNNPTMEMMWRKTLELRMQRSQQNAHFAYRGRRR